MAKTFREWNVEQAWLLPPSVMDFVPPDHVAHFVREPPRANVERDTCLGLFKLQDRTRSWSHC